MSTTITISGETVSQVDKDYQTVRSFLGARSNIFQELMNVQQLVQATPEADKFFGIQKARATRPNDWQKRKFFTMMQKIGDEIQSREKIIPLPSKTLHLQALDICMAPGGYSSAILKHNPYARVRGLSLPIGEGGHDVLLPGWQRDNRVEIKFIDITMLAAEIGFPDLTSQDHPQASKFSNDLPFRDQTFDIVFCDGQVLHTHARAQGVKDEAPRLTSAQIIIALQRIKQGGTLVMLLHQAYGPHIVRLLEAFSHFSQISLLKPTVSHKSRSSFYLVAKHLDTKNERVFHLLQEMRRTWRMYTVQNFGVDIPEDDTGGSQKSLEEIMESFGGTLISLAEPIWEIQTTAMREQFL